MQFFEEQVFPYIIKNGITDVVSVGDIFHDRTKIDAYVSQELRERFFGWFDRNGITLHTVIGNHDMLYKNTLSHHMFKNFKEFSSLKYYDQPTTIRIGKYTIGMVPWIVDYAQMDLPKDVDVLVGHFDIIGATMMRGVEATKGLNTSVFKDYQLVISGHYHIQSVLRNVHYLGSISQNDWGDFNEPKGFWLLKDNFQLECIQNEVNPRHTKIVYDESSTKVELVVYGLYADDTVITPKEAVEIAANHYVKLITKVVKSQSKVDKLLATMLATSKNNHKIELISAGEVMDDLDYSQLEEKIKENASVNHTIQNFVSEMPPVEDIEPELLSSIFEELYRETKLAMMECE